MFLYHFNSPYRKAFSKTGGDGRAGLGGGEGGRLDDLGTAADADARLRELDRKVDMQEIKVAWGSKGPKPKWRKPEEIKEAQKGLPAGADYAVEKKDEEVNIPWDPDNRDLVIDGNKRHPDKNSNEYKGLKIIAEEELWKKKPKEWDVRKLQAMRDQVSRMAQFYYYKAIVLEWKKETMYSDFRSAMAKMYDKVSWNTIVDTDYVNGLLLAEAGFGLRNMLTTETGRADSKNPYKIDGARETRLETGLKSAAEWFRLTYVDQFSPVDPNLDYAVDEILPFYSEFFAYKAVVEARRTKDYNEKIAALQQEANYASAQEQHHNSLVTSTSTAEDNVINQRKSAEWRNKKNVANRGIRHLVAQKDRWDAADQSRQDCDKYGEELQSWDDAKVAKLFAGRLQGEFEAVVHANKRNEFITKTNDDEQKIIDKIEREIK